MKKILSWLDQNILTLLTGILIVVIPLYPKLPLADLIEGYIVRARLEDILILFTSGVYFVQLARKKIQFPSNIITKAIFAYIVIGFLSTLSAIFILHTVPMERPHLLKIAFHFVRRIEYLSLFFITYASMRSRKDLYLFVKIAIVTLIGVVIYGIGQKYLYWPAFSTMNREFSKGMRLYLTPSSRVMSTFGGHYDFAAYLMMLLTLVITGFWATKNKLLKVGLMLITIPAYWSLILTASRTSFIGYLAGITVGAVMLASMRGKLRMFLNWFVAMTLSVGVMLTLGDLSERFFQVLEQPDVLVHQITQVTPLKRDTIATMVKSLTDFKDSLSLAKIKFSQLGDNIKPPDNSISTEDLAVAVSSDAPPTQERPLPPDVSRAEDDFRISQSTPSAEATASATTSGYSPNALKYGLSVAIRLDALWPRAIEGFKRSPLLGSGYSTLTKATNEEFTYAESSDNDYLRMLGETGILGTLSFFAILGIVIYFSLRVYRLSTNTLDQTIAIGTIGATVALLINATYIDIFESSKIAYTLWILAALVVKLYDLQYNKVDHAKKTD
jgi:hypothetical protein